MSSQNAKPLRAGWGCVLRCLGLVLFCIPAPLWGGQDNENITILQRMSTAFVSVMEKVSPGVVGVRIERRISRPTPDKPSTEVARSLQR